MKLTGQTKIDFEKWYLLLIRQQRKDYDKFSDDQVLRKFYRLLQSQQWGVFQDFADSVGVNISAGSFGDSGVFDYEIDFIPSDEIRDTRQEARNAAIEKFNEIYNDQ